MLSSGFLPTNKTLSLSNIRYNCQGDIISGSGPIFRLKKFDSFLIVSQRLYSVQIVIDIFDR